MSQAEKTLAEQVAAAINARIGRDGGNADIVQDLIVVEHHVVHKKTRGDDVLVCFDDHSALTLEYQDGWLRITEGEWCTDPAAFAANKTIH